jgi:uncharacterized protein (DUF433 family)
VHSPVRRVLEALATYPDRDQLRAEYPGLEDEDIRQALVYAAADLARFTARLRLDETAGQT